MSRYLSVNNIDKDVTASQPVWLLTLGTIPLFREVNLHLIYIQGILQFTNSTPLSKDIPANFDVCAHPTAVRGQLHGPEERY